MKTFYVNKNLGRYDLLSNDKDWCVSVNIRHPDSPLPCINETWSENDCPDLDGLTPVQVIDLIEEKVNSYLYTSRKAKYEPFFKWVKENRKSLEIQHAKEQIEEYKNKIIDLEQLIIELEETE